MYKSGDLWWAFITGMVVMVLVIGVLLRIDPVPRWEDKENMVIEYKDKFYRLIEVEKEYKLTTQGGD